MSAPSSSAKKVRAHRAKLRRQGLRPIQIWVPDTTTKEFAEQAHRESLAIANSPGEKDNLAFVDSLWDDAFFEK